MRTLSLITVMASLFLFSACKNEKKETLDSADETKQVSKETRLNLELSAKSGSNATGKVFLLDKNGKVTFQAKITGLTPGEHAIHLHEKSDCSADDATSTGGHWNPTFEKHGKWGDSEGYHKGDIGNITADENGNARIHFVTDQWCIGCGDEKRDIIGKAIIVHEAADDFVTQPTGNAGGRISCGAVIQ
jgi:Cu-Zn family superoxide dismutase